MTRFAILVVPVVLLFGCCPQPPPPYTGPTRPMAQVVADINDNNAKIPSLWAHHFYEADLVDDQNHAHHLAGDGVLMYQSPISLRLISNMAAVGTVFEVGSNPKVFWLKLFPETGSTLWFGAWADFANVDPDNAGMPLRPDMLLDVLGIASINTDFKALPVPLMRFDGVQDAYIFTWAGRLPDRWVTLREVYYDRATLRPRLIQLYDLNGRVALRAELNLKQFRQLAVEGLPREKWPWMAGDYKLTFPDRRSSLHFTLDEASITRRQGSITIPNPRSFRAPDPEKAGVDRVIEVGKGAAGDLH